MHLLVLSYVDETGLRWSIFLFMFLPGFQRKPGNCNAEVGGGRACINFWFPRNNLSLRWPIDTKLAVWVAYIKRQLGIATQVFVIKVKVTVTNNKNSVSSQ